jgi:hypothetical protein
MSIRLNIIVMIACSAFMLQSGASAAAATGSAAQESVRATSKSGGDTPAEAGHVSSTANLKHQVNPKLAHQRVVPVRNHRAGPGTTTRRPNSSQTRNSILAGRTSAGPFASSVPRGVANSVSTQQHPAIAAVRSPNSARSKSPATNNGQHHNPNPAIVNGSVGSIGKGAGVLDGTRMNRKL